MSRQPLLLLEHHYRGHHPLATLRYLFAPHRWRLAGSALFFVVKYSPVWATPIVFADVVNIVSSQPSIRDFSLVVEAGQTVAVVGESGSGKTTLMSLVIGFRRPDRGHILLDGRDMETLDLRQYRRHLAVVPQQTVLFSGSIRDNITYGLSEVPEAKLQEVLRMARVDEFLADLPDGLDTEIGEHGSKLSGGQRQRIAIARALIRDPHVIILDEATSALDVISEKLVQEAITELIRGRTTFIVAHRLSTIRNASRVLVLRDGQLIESGRHDDLIRAGGEFAKLRNFQV